MENVRKILVVFSDKEVLALSAEFLKDKGLDVLTAGDGAAALELALNEKPAIVVVDLNIPVINGERVFQILRNNPHTADTPFIFIANESVDIRGFRRDVDTVLMKPVKPEDLFRRINNILIGRGETRDSIGDKEIEGRLSHISLGDLLQILHLNRKEGVLKVSGDDKEGLIYIKEGAIYNAAIGSLEKEKALFRLLAWHDGKFEFSPKEIDVPQKIHRSAGNLLMEGMRQYDEWNKAKDQLPGANVRLKLKIDISALPKGLKPIIYEILFLVDFYPVVGDIVDHCVFPDYEIYQTLAALLRKGVLEELKDKKGAGKGGPEQKEILTTDQALRVREKVASRWKDMEAAIFGKILLISTNDTLIMNLVDSCKDLPGFSVNRQFITSPVHRESPIGDIATLKIYGGMDVVLFSLPVNSRMKPLWKAFLKNSIGMIMLCDREGLKNVKDLGFAKNYILSNRRIPILHSFVSSIELERAQEDELRKTLAMKREEQIFSFESLSKDRVFQLFYSFFYNLLRNEYIAA